MADVDGKTAYRRLLAAIQGLKLTGTEKAVLRALTWYGHWETGDNCRPAIATLVNDTGYTERTVQRALRSLECDQPCGDARCNHRGVIRVTAPASRYSPTTYGLRAEVLGVQLGLDAARFTDKRPAAHVPERERDNAYARVVRRSWP